MVTTSTKTELKAHPIAALFPLMRGQALENLAEDIKKNGQLHPITLWHDQIIDGRNRYAACRMVGSSPFVEEWEGDEDQILGKILSLNVDRRHMNESNRALVAARLWMRATVGMSGRGQPTIDDRKKRLISTFSSAEDAGKRLLVSRDLVKKARKVLAGKLEYVESIEAAEKVRGKHDKEVTATIEWALWRINEDRKNDIDDEADENADLIEWNSDTVRILHGDFTKIGDDVETGSVELIFTDPPYDRETLPIYEDLGKFAARVLKPGGSLVTYLGQRLLPDVLSLIAKGSNGSLEYWWTLNCDHDGGSYARLPACGVIVGWKPMLWFIKTPRKFDSLMVDKIRTDQDKRFHEWGQSATEAAYYIEHLTKPADLVVDPFCGGGTTAYAAHRLKRLAWTCDISGIHVSTARARLSEVIDGHV